MDIKSLFDAAIAAGINLANDDAVHDCADVWLAACLNDHEWTEEYLPDFLDFDALDLHKIASDSHKAYQDSQWLQNNAKAQDHTGLNLAYCTTSVMYASGVGAKIVKNIIASAKTIVAEHLYDWFAECQGYLIDMNQCHEEDAAQRRREDRDAV